MVVLLGLVQQMRVLGVEASKIINGGIYTGKDAQTHR
jgi:hypothetical protein